jgi:hypothetical protein
MRRALGAQLIHDMFDQAVRDGLIRRERIEKCPVFAGFPLFSVVVPDSGRTPRNAG